LSANFSSTLGRYSGCRRAWCGRPPSTLSCFFSALRKPSRLMSINSSRPFRCTNSSCSAGLRARPRGCACSGARRAPAAPAARTADGWACSGAQTAPAPPACARRPRASRAAQRRARFEAAHHPHRMLCGAWPAVRSIAPGPDLRADFQLCVYVWPLKRARNRCGKEQCFIVSAHSTAAANRKAGSTAAGRWTAAQRAWAAARRTPPPRARAGRASTRTAPHCWAWRAAQRPREGCHRRKAAAGQLAVPGTHRRQAFGRHRARWTAVLRGLAVLPA